MQPTTCFHDSITNPILQEADFVFHHPISLHPTSRVFNPDSDGRHQAMACLLRWGEFPTRGFFLGLHDRQSLISISLEAHILIEIPSRWEGILFQFREAFIIDLPFRCGTQETNPTGLIDYQEVFDRVAFLLAAVAFLLVLGIGGTMDRSLSTIMPKRGDQGQLSSVALRAARLNGQPCRQEGAFDVLRPDAIRDEGGESTSSHALATSPKAVLALLD
jgi:hypothetical protein